MTRLVEAKAAGKPASQWLGGSGKKSDRDSTTPTKTQASIAADAQLGNGNDSSVRSTSVHPMVQQRRAQHGEPEGKHSDILSHCSGTARNLTPHRSPSLSLSLPLPSQHRRAVSTHLPSSKHSKVIVERTSCANLETAFDLLQSGATTSF